MSDRLKALKKYLDKEQCWVGSQNFNKDFKEELKQGKIVVLSIRTPAFDTAVVCDSIETAEKVCNFNPHSHARVIDLDADQVLWEEEKGWQPRKRRKHDK